MKIYKDSSNSPLHKIFRAKEASFGRTDLVEDEEFLQCSVLRFNTGKNFKLHKHINKSVPNKSIAQESWCVIRGSVLVTYYDTNFQLLGKETLRAGDISITLGGGHTYDILEGDTLVYEFKTGPYYGVELDKVYPNE